MLRPDQVTLPPLSGLFSGWLLEPTGGRGDLLRVAAYDLGS